MMMMVKTMREEYAEFHKHVENLQLSKGKCQCRCSSVPFTRETISRCMVELDSKKLQLFLGIMNYVRDIQIHTQADICKIKMDMEHDIPRTI